MPKGSGYTMSQIDLTNLSYRFKSYYEKKSNLNSISYKLNPENLSRITSIFSN